jgi:dienelactone hydrolase
VIAYGSSSSARQPDAMPGPFWAAFMSPGRYAVGLTVIAARDSTRPDAHGRARHVQIVIWYPAGETGRASLTYGEYFGFMASDTGSTSDTLDIDRSNRTTYGDFLRARGVPDSIVAKWFAARMAAHREALAIGGRFPALLIAQGNDQSAHDQAVLAEYLASTGYVVATCPSPTRISGPLVDTASVGRSAEEQADDLAFILRSLHQRNDVDPRRVGVVAHSFGARGALLMAMRRPTTVTAIVSLDGGIGTATGRQSMESSRSFDRRRAVAPILHFDETLDSYMAPDDGLLSELAAPVWLVHTVALHHHHFTTLAPSGALFPPLAVATGATSRTSIAYAAVARLTRGFLDDYVRGETGAFASACTNVAFTDRNSPRSFQCERLQRQSEHRPTTFRR